MKILFYENDGTVVSIIENVTGDIIEDLDEIKWNDGRVRGINKKYLIVEDEYDIQKGEALTEIPIEDLISKKIREVNFNVRNACLKGFTSSLTGYSYETESHDQENFKGRLQSLTNFPEKFPMIPWKVATGEVINHTPEEFKYVCGELDDFLSSKILLGWNIKEQLKSCTSIQEIESINLEVE